MRRPPPRSTLFPYTTLFRSAIDHGGADAMSAPFAFWRGDGLLSDMASPKHPLDQLYRRPGFMIRRAHQIAVSLRSEEHTSELQSHSDLVCRLLLEKKKNKNKRKKYQTKKNNIEIYKERRTRHSKYPTEEKIIHIYNT